MELWERNYMLVYRIKWNGNVDYRYFRTEEEMNEYINKEEVKKNWDILHKYQIKEII